MENNSSRYSTSYGAMAEGFTLVNAQASVGLAKGLLLDAGINNLFDKYYSLVEGFPEAGRNYFVNLVYRLAK